MLAAKALHNPLWKSSLPERQIFFDNQTRQRIDKESRNMLWESVYLIKREEERKRERVSEREGEEGGAYSMFVTTTGHT